MNVTVIKCDTELFHCLQIGQLWHSPEGRSATVPLAIMSYRAARRLL